MQNVKVKVIGNSLKASGTVYFLWPSRIISFLRQLLFYGFWRLANMFVLIIFKTNIFIV